MRRLLLAAASLVVLVANGWGVWEAARNRTEPRGGRLQLDERDVPLQPIAWESSVTALRLNWRIEGSVTERRHPPAWLDTRKIIELGFDCSLLPSSPKARRHYTSMPARRVFLALEHQGDTGLMVLDAARDPDQLRARYPDLQKYIICRGFVGLTFRTHDQDGAPLSEPQLEAWVHGPSPPEIFVPKPTNRLLRTLHRVGFEEPQRPVAEPRYSARVSWGRNYEPWVDEVRALTK